MREQLDAFLATAQGDVLLWHDAAGFFADVVGWLGLPGDVRLAREDLGSRFELARALNDIAPDERILFYRTHPEVIEDKDWFCDLEARCASFHPTAALEAVELPGQDEVESSRETSPVPVAALPILSDDWYPTEKFTALAEGFSAEQLGFRPYADCFVRDNFGSLWEYYDSLFVESLVGIDSLPAGLRETQSFRTYTYQRSQKGTLFSYDDETWITPSGLAELEIGQADLQAFVDGAVAASKAAQQDCFTVPWLRHNASGLSLLQYDFDDCFYESVLFCCGDRISSGLLSKKRIFAAKGKGARGRDLARSIVSCAGSLSVEDLLDELSGSFGIGLPRGQLITLSRKAGLFYSPELDRIFLDHQTFIDGVE